MNTKQINVIKGILFISITIYLSITFKDALLNLVSKISFLGWVKGSVLLRIIIALGFARGFQLIAKSLFVNVKTVLIFFIGVLVGFTINFIIQPIYNTDYSDYGTTELSINKAQLKIESNNLFNLNDKPAIVSFFSTNCKSCKEVSNIIGDLQFIGDTPQVIALFPGTEEAAIQFMKENKGKGFKHIMIENQTFFQETANYSFPSIFLVDKEGNTIKHWEGSSLGYLAFDLIKANK